MRRVSSFRINYTEVWLVIEALQELAENRTDLMTCSEFLCYFSLQQPSVQLCGEIIRDEGGRPRLFQSEDEAEIFAMKFVKNRLGL